MFATAALPDTVELIRPIPAFSPVTPMPPPSTERPVTVFPDTVVPIIVRLLPPWMPMPPPMLVAVLPTTWLLLSARLPLST